MFTILISISIIFTGVTPQGLQLNTPGGEVMVSLSEQDVYALQDGQVSSKILLRNIQIRLENLQALYTINGQKSELIESLLQEIHCLLSLFPENSVIVIAPYIPLAQPTPVEPLPDNDISDLVQYLENEPFSDNKLNILRTVALSKFFWVEQVERILDEFAFEDDRLSAVRILYPKILDIENTYRLYDKFQFSDYKKELANILQ